MATPKNRSTLYRFVSLRSPELSKKENQKNRFVFHPGNDTDGFFDAVAHKPPFQDNWHAMLEYCAEFEAFQTVDEVDAIDRDIFVISDWIIRNKSQLDSEVLLDKISTVIALDAETELSLWDNLFYQVLTQKSFYIKEAIMQMLVVQNLLKQVVGLSDPEILAVLPDLALARVVLPSVLFVETAIEGIIEGAPEDETLVLGKDLLDAQDIAAAKIEIETNKSLINELELLEKKYFQGYNENLAVVQKEYAGTIKSIIAGYQSDYTTAKLSLCEIPKPDNYDPNDICNLPNIAYPTIPEFEFIYEEEFDYDTIEEQLSITSTEIFSGLPNINEVKTFQEAIAIINNNINAISKSVLSKTKTSQNIIVMGDSAIYATPDSGSDSFTFGLSSSSNVNGTIAMFMCIQLPSSIYTVSKFVYSLIYSGDTSNTDFTFESSTNGNVITLSNMFNNSLTASDATNLIGLSGKITFTNGKRMEFNIDPFSLKNSFKGILTPIDEIGGSSYIENPFIPKKFGYRQLGIADYKKVVSEICCYDAGEVAHIENIMAREFKEKTTEKNIVTETTTFESEEVERESLTDTTSTQRFEMQTEIAKMLQEQQQTSAYINASVSGQMYTLDTGGAYASNNTKEQSNSQAVSQSKEITQRALERIVSRVKKEKTVKITESFKDLNSHIFDNRTSDQHVSGVYRFVNAIYKNQIYNYGKRLMYEFMVPQPSKLHRLGLEANKHNGDTVLLQKPIDPRINGYADFTTINSATYQALAAKYGAKVNQYPEELIYIGKSFSIVEPSRDKPSTINEAISIPDNYVSARAKAYITGAPEGYSPGWWGSSIVTHIGPTTATVGPILQNVNFFPIEKYRGSVPVNIGVIGYHLVDATITIECQISPAAIEEWKKETYEAIIAGYEAQLDAYNQQLSEIKANGVQILDSNPLFYRQFEQNVLRKNCISYLIDNSPSSARRFGRKMYNADETFANYQVSLTQGMDNYTSFAKFMEQAFEWNLMSYNFYPYYWGNIDEWDQLYQFESNDALYRSFMQAGLARVVVTVKPGFEDAVMHYMALGQIWNGGQMPVIGDPLYLSIVDELKEQEYVIEETWETVLPTNLVALQSSGVALEADGLPCSEDCLEALGDNPFTGNGNVLGGSGGILS